MATLWLVLLLALLATVIGGWIGATALNRERMDDEPSEILFLHQDQPH